MYHRSEGSFQDAESSQGQSAELARLSIHGEGDELTPTATSQPGPPRLAAIPTDRHTLPHPRRPTTTHPTLSLQHRESNLRSDPSSRLPSRSTTPVSASTPLFRQPTATATYITSNLTAASQTEQNGDRLLVAYNQPHLSQRMLRQSASEVDLRRSLQRSGSPSTPTHAFPPRPDQERSLPRYEARGGSSRTPPFYASSSSDLLSAASFDDDETSVDKSSPEPTASTSTATTEANGWDQYVEKLGVSKYRCIYTPPEETEPCGQRGDKRHLVTRHIKAVHLNIRPFKCSYCDRGFPSNSGLETHINTHTGETPYECPFCQRGFADRAGLHRHKVKEHDYQPRSRRSQPVFMPPEIHPQS